MEVNKFNRLFLNTLSENLLSEKNKEIVLLGDFNIDLLKYEKDHNTADFLDQMYSASVAPPITSPTQITSHSRTLIDNIFSMDLSENSISGNIVTSLINLKQTIIRTYINVTLKVLINKYSLRIFKT